MRCLYPLDCKLRAGEGRSVGDECSYRDVDGCRVMCMRWRCDWRRAYRLLGVRHQLYKNKLSAPFSTTEDVPVVVMDAEPDRPVLRVVYVCRGGVWRRHARPATQSRPAEHVTRDLTCVVFYLLMFVFVSPDLFVVP